MDHRSERYNRQLPAMIEGDALTEVAKAQKILLMNNPHRSEVLTDFDIFDTIEVWGVKINRVGKIRVTTRVR